MIERKTNWTKVKENIKNFWQDEDGMGVVEIVLIIVVLIGLVIIFKSQITIILIVTSQTYKFQQKLELRYFLKYLSESDFLGFFLQSLSLESGMF